MLAATALLLLGSVFVLSAHGQGELDVALGPNYRDVMRWPIKPQNGTWTHRYFIPNYRLSWVGAVAECAKMGGVLADVRSRAELDFLQTLSKRTEDAFSHWVGAGAVGLNKTLVWVSDGSEIGKDLWKKGHPNGKDGNCVLFLFRYSIPVLEVYDCTQQRAFICKSPLSK